MAECKKLYFVIVSENEMSHDKHFLACLGRGGGGGGGAVFSPEIFLHLELDLVQSCQLAKKLHMVYLDCSVY